MKTSFNRLFIRFFISQLSWLSVSILATTLGIALIDIVLYQPEIPPNTGNIIRLCANMGFHLCLIHPLGFRMDDKLLQRAGLDYHEWANLQEFECLEDYLDQRSPQQLYACSTKGKRSHTSPSYQKGDAFLFGPESRGLPANILSSLPSENIVRLPMRAESRSLNLSNAVAIFAYEAWRQLDFAGAIDVER